jgi:GNAT superfamily N-acetyltransferase
MRTAAAVAVAPLRSEDRAAWEELARGYHAFYDEQFPQETYEHVWSRLSQATDVHALGAYDEGRLVGIVHYLFHRHVWQSDVCYLQDLYVDERRRGHGVGRALIAQVEQQAREHGAFRVYWMTRHDNTAARFLYDKIATHSGFIRYEDPV